MNSKRCQILAMSLIAFCSYALNAQDISPLKQMIRLDGASMQLLDILHRVGEEEGVNLSFDERIVPNNSIDIKAQEISIEALLNQILKGTGLEFKEVGKQIVIYVDAKSKKVTLSGKITTELDGEYLVGATVLVKELKIGVAANRYGFYSVTVPPGAYTFVYSFIGFKSREETLFIATDRVLDVELQESVEQLEEVVVLGENENDVISSSETSKHHVKIQRIRSMPALGGESDVLKAIQFLPGIQSANEGTTGFSVRGGGYDQNLILLDEAPVYNPAHAVGFFSVFNPDAVKDIQVYKGAIPARYGGRLSSVIDIKMKEGNSKSFSAAGSIGAISSRLLAEGPIGKSVTFLVSGRYGYVGQTAKILADWVGVDSYDRSSEINFSDINAKIGIELSERDHVYISTYSGSDHFKHNVIFANNTLNWSNQTGTFRWNHTFNSKLFSNFTYINSSYRYQYIENNDIRNYKWKANFRQNGIKLDFDYFASLKHLFNVGLAITNHRFSPGSIEPNDESSIITPFELDTKRAIESALYASHEYKIQPHLLVQYGVRISDFRNIGRGTKYYFDTDGETVLATKTYDKGELINEYVRVAPRASLNYIINDKNSIKAAYNRTYQYLHQVSNSSVGLPTDVWLPVDNNIKPRSADQVLLGYFKSLNNMPVLLSVEGYYKTIHNVIDYKDNADLFLNNTIETQIRIGEGTAYGVELMAEKSKGNLSGWISYTWSKAEHEIDGVNNGKSYNPRYDKRHNIAVVASYRITDKLSASANFAYITGGGITVPLGFYNSAGNAYNYYSERNAFRLPAYHQLDISAEYKLPVIAKRLTHKINIGVTNLYNRKNTFSLFVKNNEDDPTMVYKMYLFGIMPSLNYEFNF